MGLTLVLHESEKKKNLRDRLSVTILVKLITHAFWLVRDYLA